MADLILVLSAAGALLSLAVPAAALARFGLVRVRGAVYGAVAGALVGIAVLPLLGLAAAVALLIVSLAAMAVLVLLAYRIWQTLLRR